MGEIKGGYFVEGVNGVLGLVDFLGVKTGVNFVFQSHRLLPIKFLIIMRFSIIRIFQL